MFLLYWRFPCIILLVLNGRGGKIRDMNQLFVTMAPEIYMIVDQSVAANLKDKINNYFPRVISAAIILIVGYLIYRLLVSQTGKILRKTQINPLLHSIIKQLVRIALILVIIIAVADALGISAAPLTAILGSGGLALSLAAKDSMSDVAAGIVILSNHAFTVGDHVDIGANSGLVGKITLTYVQLETSERNKIYIPNSSVAKASIINHSNDVGSLLNLKYTIGAKDELERAYKAILKAVTRCGGILKEPGPEVAVESFTAAAVNLSLKVWVEREEALRLPYAINELVKQELDAAGINC